MIVALATLALLAGPPDPDLAGMPGLPGAATSGGPTTAPTTTSSLARGFVQELRFGGRLQSRATLDLRSDDPPSGGPGPAQPAEDIRELRNRLDLELAGRLTPTFSVQLGARLTHEVRTPTANLDGARYAYEGELREAHFTRRFDDATLTVGNQVVRWGSTDTRSPNDVINPVDYREGVVPDLETPLLPIAAARATHRVADWLTIEAVYVPFFNPHRAPVYGSDWSPVGDTGELQGLVSMLKTLVGDPAEEDVQDLLIAPTPPDEKLENGSVGGRLLLSGVGWDLHLNIHYGWDRLPELIFDDDLLVVLSTLQRPDLSLPDLLPFAADGTFDRLQAKASGGERLFESRYHRRLSTGADGVWVIGDFALKGEVAYRLSTTVYDRAFHVRRPPVLLWVAGADYLPDTDLNLTVEISGARLIESPPDAGYWLIERNLINAAGIARWLLLDEDLRLQLGGQYGVTQRDLLIMPEVAYRPAEGHWLALGVTILEGDENAIIGQFDRNDSIYGRYEISF